MTMAGFTTIKPVRMRARDEKNIETTTRIGNFYLLKSGSTKNGALIQSRASINVRNDPLLAT